MSKRKRKHKKQNGDIKAMTEKNTEKYGKDGQIIPATGEVAGEVKEPPTMETQTADKQPTDRELREEARAIAAGKTNCNLLRDIEIGSIVVAGIPGYKKRDDEEPVCRIVEWDVVDSECEVIAPNGCRYRICKDSIYGGASEAELKTGMIKFEKELPSSNKPVQKNRPKRSIPGASKFVECQNIILESVVLSPIKNRCGTLKGGADRTEAIALCNTAVREIRCATDKSNTMGRIVSGLVEAGFALPIVRISAYIKSAPVNEPIDIEELRKAAYGREA